MLDGSGFNSLRRKARLAQIVCVVAVLLGETSMVKAEIPLPRARPANIPGDQALTSTNPQSSPCQQQLGAFAEFKALPPITGPGEFTANDVVALDSVVLPNKHHPRAQPLKFGKRCMIGQTARTECAQCVGWMTVAIATSRRKVCAMPPMAKPPQIIPTVIA
jgi:hypothetical protein